MSKYQNIVKNLTRKEINKLIEVLKKERNQRKAEAERDRKVIVESDLLEQDHAIKCCLQLESADIDRAIQLMNNYKELKFTKFILIKHPLLVATMKKLRAYRGNLKNWGFTDEEKRQFEEKAKQVHNLGASIYNSFESLFDVPEGSTFIDIFNVQVQLFKEKTSHLTADELVYYVDDKGDF